MDLQPHSEVESALVSTNPTGSASYAGAFFPQASGFNILGGVFTSNVTNVCNPPDQPSDFQTIRLGDVKLIKEVRLSPESGVVGRQSRGEATNYISHTFRKPSIDYINCPVWIRPSTGELCLDLVQGGPETSFELPLWRVPVLRLENVSLDASDSEDIIISSLSEDQYHKLCSDHLIAQFRCFQVSTQHPVGPGIFRSDPRYKTCVRITEPLILPEEELHWANYGRPRGKLLPNSWIRYDSRQTCTLKLELQLLFWSYEIQKAWLAQANHVYAELGEVAHVEDYVCIDQVRFILRISVPNDVHIYINGPPVQRIGPSTHLGADRLSTEDARMLGFPRIHIDTVLVGLSFDRSVYNGLRRFHEGKGFNPDSGEIARQLGYSLYELLRDVNSCAPFPAHDVERLWCQEEDPALCRALGHYL
ncbi:hypothetical protein MSAN_01520300 [Mycena sanguinolenta]|uniref:Uncharacterized protein n=1 Tax=Mycena sanguinolenta TaxID=230812 RepID=A0A8H7CZN9_9AGAR|nr:hypothetical protein MSAN_01520300 [Mycena sanguinolenta]